MNEIALDVLYLADLAFLFHYLGLPLVGSGKSVSQASLVVGFSIFGVATTLLYAAGLPLYPCSVLFHAAATASFLWSWRQRGWRFPSVPGRRDPAGGALYLLAVVALFFLMLPKWVGGLQFSIFQGNQWDHFGYLESAVGYASRPYRFFTTSGVQQFIENPLWLIARDNLGKRPTIHLVFAVTGGGLFFKAAMSQLGYTFLVFLLFQSIVAIQYLLRVLGASLRPAGDRPSNEPIFHLLIGMVVSLGFWGQYAFDLNAWSQLAGMPTMISVVATTLLLATTTETGDERLRILTVLSILISGCLFAYPESLLFHLPSLAAMLVFAGLAGFVPWTMVGATLAAVGIGLSPGLFYYQGTLGFGFRQAVYGLQGDSNFWTFFQRFLFGRGDLLEDLRGSAESVLALRGWYGRTEGIRGTDWLLFLSTTWLSGQGWLAGIARSCELAVSLMAGALGLYFYTPVSALSPVARVAWSALLGLFCMLLIKVVVGSSFERIRAAWRNGGDERVRLLLIVFTLALAAEGTMFLARRQFWSAGKALSFISPYGVVLVLLPLLDALRDAKLFSWRIGGPALLLATYATSQLGLGVYRVVKAAGPDGIHYSPVSYPSIQHDAVNAKTNYKLDSIEEAMARIRAQRCTLVEIAVTDTWVRQYLMTRLTIDNTKFFVRDEIRSYFSTGRVLGYQDYRTLNDGAAPDGAIRERWAYDPAVMTYRYVLVAD